MKLRTLLTSASAIAFLIYGVMCLSSESMAEDFHRFGLERLRVLTGVLELLGGSGLLVGLKWRPALLISAGGLALLMLIAFSVRLKMHDSVLLDLPSVTLMLINGYIFAKSIKE